jgi:hypothetical protein
VLLTVSSQHAWPTHYQKEKRTEIAYRARKEGKAVAVKEFGCSYHAVSLALERDKENDENCPQRDRNVQGGLGFSLTGMTAM